MKRYISLFILLFMLPLVVNAEDGNLYDVFKNEAENSGLAKEYTGEHHDSFTQEPFKKIYHWYAENNEQANQILEKNNVIFAGHCWEMFRTTDTGGVKLIYNGKAENEKCHNIKEDRAIGTSQFNPRSDNPIYVGYKYGTVYNYSKNTDGRGWKYAPDVEYDKNSGLYVLKSKGEYNVEVKESVNGTSLDYHHYTCGDDSITCETVKYVFEVLGEPNKMVYYINLSNGKKFEDALKEMFEDNTTNSKVKEYIDSWYQNNLNEYTYLLEDTIFCNDRTLADKSKHGWDPNGGKPEEAYMFTNRYLNNNLNCPKETDKFSVSNPKAKLEYPIALMTASEANLLNNKLLRSDGFYYWLMTPSDFINRYTFIKEIQATGSISSDYTASVDYNGRYYCGNVRPVISLKSNSKYLSGDGSKDSPYIIDLNNYYKVIVEEPVKKGDLEFENVDISNLTEGTEVKFKIIPVKGYKLKDLTITDEDNNNVDYTTKDKINFKFIMPATDVTIKPQYKEINNDIPNNPNTKRQILLIVISVIIAGIMTTLFIKKKKRLN